MSETPGEYDALDNLFTPISQPSIHNLTPQMQELLNAEYPISDPSWDYSQVWQNVMMMRDSITRLIDLLEQTENATPETDRQVRGYLLHIQGEAIASLNFLPGGQSSPPEHNN
jgi:hypothetical protein